jgi:predicted nicotinamide N-methyase
LTGSLAYRNNEAAILRGEVPAKYTRLLPFIDGDRVIELGAAEGVLACLLAKNGKTVTAVERQVERHTNALQLALSWNVTGATFIRGDVIENPDWFEGHDTLVAVRMIYYLRDRLGDVFAEAAKHIPTVVLCGNKNRAAWWRQGIPDKEGGPVNYYASAEGMRALLERHGYRITAEETEGDPIVVGRR